MSVDGRFLIGVEQPGSSGSQVGMTSASLQGMTLPVRPLGLESTNFGFNFKSYPLGWIVEVPPYFAIVTVSIGAAAPWIRWCKRFSLRTLLIATTVVAVVLGLAVWTLRKQ